MNSAALNICVQVSAGLMFSGPLGRYIVKFLGRVLMSNSLTVE